MAALDPFTIGGQLAQAGQDIFARRQRDAQMQGMLSQQQLQAAQAAKAQQDALFQQQQRESYSSLGDVFKSLDPGPGFVGPMQPMAERVRGAAPAIAAHMARAGGERFGELGKLMLALGAGDASAEGLQRLYAGAGHAAPVHGLLPQQAEAYQGRDLANKVQIERMQQEGQNFRHAATPFEVQPGNAVLTRGQLMGMAPAPQPIGAPPASPAAPPMPAGGIRPLYTAPAAPGAGAPSGYQWIAGASGRELAPIPGGPADPAARVNTKPPTLEERNIAGFGARMMEAQKIMDALEAEGINSAALLPAIAGSVPFVGDALRNQVMGPKQQLYRQAQENWVRANLRKESGAAIGVDEMAREIANYFPQPGDEGPVIAQKRAIRDQVARGVVNTSGQAYPMYYGGGQQNAAPGIRPVAPGVAAGQRPRAVNPETGVAVEWDGSAWVPAQ